MEGSKIHLSATEMALVQNTDIILTKNNILKKAISMFGDLQAVMWKEKPSPTQDIFSVPPKISKGENYMGLPYVVLDYPRYARGENLCFIRTMFWWGHFFSSTLQLSGAYRHLYLNKVLSAYPTLAAGHFYLGVHPDPWQHHFEKTNYCPVNSLTKEQFDGVAQEQRYIKIAAKWPLQEWDDAAIKLYKSWLFLTGLIT